MAEQAEREDDELELLNEDEPGGETQPGETTPGAEDDQIEGGDAEDEIIEVTFGDEAAPASEDERDPGLVKHLRSEIRKRDAELTTLRKVDVPQVIEVGEKPTLESCEWDETAFETALDTWKERKAEADKAQTEAQDTAKRNQEAWAAELEDFGRKKAALKVPDFDAAEEEVVAGLSQVQQAIVIRAADDSAKVILALGRHPDKLKTLAAIQDPIKFTAALVKLEGQLKVTTRRKAPEVESDVRGSAPLSAASDKELERLEKDAERTGDRSKVIAHKRKLKTQGRS